MEGLHFYEEQQFRQKWLWVLLLLVNAYYLWSIFEAFASPASPTAPTIIAGLVIFGASLLFYFMKLKTSITEEAIKIQFTPFLKRTIHRDQVKKMEIREYSPLAEYGGWGIRFGFKGMAYNVSGNMGLQLELSNGKKILIGTQKPEALKSALNHFSETV